MAIKPTYEELEQKIKALEKDSDENKRLELKLKDAFSEIQRFHEAMDHIPAYVYMKDPQARYVYANRLTLELFGCSAEELVGCDDTRFFPPDTVKRLREVDLRVFAGEQTTEEIDVADAGAKRRVSWEVKTPIHVEPERKTIWGLLGISTDITERKRAEDKLRESHQIIEGILDTIPVRVFWKDQNLIYLGCNKLFARDAGFDDPKDIIGKDDYQIGWRDQAELYRNDDLEVIKSGDSKFFVEEPQTTPEGNSITLLTSKIPLRAASGEIIGVLGTYMDITDRKQAENALKENELRYKSAQRIGQVGNWEYDLTTYNFWGSDEAKRIYGFDPESKDFTADEVENCIPDQERIHQALVDLIEHNTPYDLEFEIRPITGPSKKTIKSIAEVLFDENGSPQKVLGVIQDITQKNNAKNEKIRLEKQLKHSQKLESIGNLAGGIAHDFNNILSSIIGFTELALDDTTKGTPLEDSLQEVYTAAKRARDLVKQILAFARQSDEERKPIRVVTIAKEVLKLVRSTIPTTIEIKENLESQSLIEGNSSQVHQLLMNLCTNAGQAMEDAGGILEVRSTDVELNEQSSLPLLRLKSGNYMKITVSDTGHGIPQDILGAIFEPYFTTKGVGEGTGMGLALAHGIVESYGGKITVESELGKGTVFSIYLPTTQKREDYRPYEEKKLPSGTERILFVDDELPIAKMGSQVLERLGYQVTIHTSSVEALELFKSKPNEFDLVITDMTMPNMSGDELAIELMKIRPDIPVILCTGYSKKISDETASEIGIKAFAYKPVVKADLAKTVRKVLDDQPQEQTTGRILLIDDESEIRKLFIKKLAGIGCEIIEACDGKEGLKLYHETRPDLVITDLVMPEKEGLETITELKREFPNVKIIAISGGGRKGQDAYLHIAKGLGAERTFPKPIDWPELIKTVRELLK